MILLDYFFIGFGALALAVVLGAGLWIGVSMGEKVVEWLDKRYFNPPIRRVKYGDKYR